MELGEKIVKHILSAMAFIVLATGCSGLVKRNERVQSQPPAPQAPTSTWPAPPSTTEPTAPIEYPPAAPTTEAPPPEMTPPKINAIPKIGLILGPGGALTYAHIGVLQELQKQKIPVAGVTGMEWGSAVAALYAQKGLVNEAEWQMTKLKPEVVQQKSLIGSSGKPADWSGLNDFFKAALGNGRVEEGRLPFACASLNITKNQIYVMNRGSYAQLLPYCLAYPPITRPWQGSVAAVREVKILADHLRARGANYVVFVNVLPPPNPNKFVAGDGSGADSIVWTEMASAYWKKMPGVDYALQVFPQYEKPILSFEDRRDILTKGASRSEAQVKKLAERLGL